MDEEERNLQGIMEEMVKTGDMKRSWSPESEDWEYKYDLTDKGIKDAKDSLKDPINQVFFIEMFLNDVGFFADIPVEDTIETWKKADPMLKEYLGYGVKELPNKIKEWSKMKGILDNDSPNFI